MLAFIVLTMFLCFWIPAEIGSQMAGASITADVVRAVGRGINDVMEQLVPLREPLELPEWTGRERESLRADLEAAEKAFMADRLVTEDTAAVELEKYPIVWEEELPGIVQPYGLFAEALEAFIEAPRKK